MGSVCILLGVALQASAGGGMLNRRQSSVHQSMLTVVIISSTAHRRSLHHRYRYSGKRFYRTHVGDGVGFTKVQICAIKLRRYVRTIYLVSRIVHDSRNT